MDTTYSTDLDADEPYAGWMLVCAWAGPRAWKLHYDDEAAARRGLAQLATEHGRAQDYLGVVDLTAEGCSQSSAYVRPVLRIWNAGASARIERALASMGLAS
jgi:hypothetical protein